MDDQLVLETLLHIARCLSVLDICVICSQVAFLLSIVALAFIVIRDILNTRKEKLRAASHTAVNKRRH